MYIITDLTEFKDEKVCIAVIHSETGICIRPLPYLTLTDYDTQDLKPGKVIAFGRISQKPDLEPPHTEDRICSFRVQRDATLSEFKAALNHGCFEDGFGTPTLTKDLPVPNQAVRSLITHRPRQLSLVDTQFGLKAHVDRWRYLPVKDHRYCHRTAALDLSAINHHFRQALDRNEVLLRLGLTRPNRSGEAQKCYIQLNGIYTFLEGTDVP